MKIAWSGPAKRDLDTILLHIAADNPEAALAVCDRIEEAVRSLLMHPRLGRPGRIDGLMGRRTRNGIYKFKKDNGLRVNQELTVELYDALLAEADKVQDTTGYNMCNETDFLVWAAIGQQIEGDLVSTGWFRLDPDTCTKAIKDKLANNVFYTYAEAQGTGGKRIAWGGPHMMCTMDNRFTIVGRDDCEKRGFRRTGFERVETGAKPGWTQTFTLSEEH